MPTRQIKWSSLLNLTELEFIPSPPKVLEITDELIQSLSWLTGATNHDRKLLRCTEDGALLVADPWSNLTEVENDELVTTAGVPDVFTATVPNKGVLVAVGPAIARVTFVKVSGGSTERMFIPAGWLFWYPHTTYSVTVTTVPAGSGTSTYVGIAAFN